MHHKLMLLIVLVLSLSACALFEAEDPQDIFIDPEDGTMDTLTVTGMVIENDIGVPADGNNVMTIELEDGETRTVLYMEGGLVLPEVAEQQCNDNDPVNQSAMEIPVGARVTVVGTPHEFYDIEVCSDTSFSITVVSDTNVSEPVGIEGEGSAPIDPPTDVVLGGNTGRGNLESQLDENGNVITRSLSGNVVDFISDCPFDGLCAYIVETDSGDQVTVIWVEGDSPNCMNDPFNGGDTNIQLGDTLDATGRVIDNSTISACGDEAYSITKTS